MLHFPKSGKTHLYSSIFPLGGSGNKLLKTTLYISTVHQYTLLWTWWNINGLYRLQVSKIAFIWSFVSIWCPVLALLLIIIVAVRFNALCGFLHQLTQRSSKCGCGVWLWLNTLPSNITTPAIFLSSLILWYLELDSFKLFFWALLLCEYSMINRKLKFALMVSCYSLY